MGKTNDILDGIKAFSDLMTGIGKLFASASKNHHTYSGKSGEYIKEGPKSMGRKGKTISYKKK
ncbi:MAG: hypothetical protein N4A71_14995 [Carboxylicivirga sp.]|jgi:hypothetical protein|nr:hypothetical protein [Carboxylicivirga sp.]